MKLGITASKPLYKSKPTKNPYIFIALENIFQYVPNLGIICYNNINENNCSKNITGFLGKI